MRTRKEIKSINDNDSNLAESKSVYLCLDNLYETQNDIQSESELLDLASLALECECALDNECSDESPTLL